MVNAAAAALARQRTVVIIITRRIVSRKELAMSVRALSSVC